MANPLTSVIMNNISKKALGKDQSKENKNISAININDYEEEILKSILNKKAKSLNSITPNKSSQSNTKQTKTSSSYKKIEMKTLESLGSKSLDNKQQLNEKVGEEKNTKKIRNIVSLSDLAK